MKNIARIGLLLVLASAPSAKAFDPFSRFLSEVEEGNQLYRNQHFDQALEQYEQAEQTLSQEPKIHFNRGNALFKLGHAKEAREAFLRATGIADPEIKKKIYYNIGNTHLSEGGFHDAISYYRRALEIDPAFDDARFNMEMALQAIKQQQQQKDQSQKQDDSKKDEKNQEDQKQDEQKKDQEQEKKDNPKDDQKKEDSPKDQQSDQNKQQQEQQKQQSQEQEKSSGQDQQEKQNGQEEQKKQQPQQDQSNNQQNDQKKNEPQQAGQAGSEQPLPLKEEEMSPEQLRDMLKSIQENEKAFQMYRFELPEFNQEKTVEKDW